MYALDIQSKQRFRYERMCADVSFPNTLTRQRKGELVNVTYRLVQAAEEEDKR